MHLYLPPRFMRCHKFHLHLSAKSCSLHLWMNLTPPGPTCLLLHPQYTRKHLVLFYFNPRNLIATLASTQQLSGYWRNGNTGIFMQQKPYISHPED
ncbi:hypothetical protein OIU77_027009 [Salix suchowensis]|uniref:Uncharacterized protein n=1 Tax=Salix suchowensis TaxID=1278906 RepID=A0ABQ9BS07_9ROSI|nr:hypothetical protein OIU77_027009 [Salix suchowensis]